MSHVSTIQIEISDLDSLENACSLLGLELIRGQKSYRWYGRFLSDYHGDDSAYKHGIDPKDYGKCEHAIRIPNNKEAYEVGVVKRDDGNFVLVWDFWQGGFGLVDKIGENAVNLKREYALAVASKEMRRQGFRVSRQVDQKTGKPKMIARRTR